MKHNVVRRFKVGIYAFFSLVFLLDIFAESQGLPSLMGASRLVVMGFIEFSVAFVFGLLCYRALNFQFGQLREKIVVASVVLSVLFLAGYLIFAIGVERSNAWDRRVVRLIHGEAVKDIVHIEWAKDSRALSDSCRLIGKKRVNLFGSVFMYNFVCENNEILRVRLSVDDVNNKGAVFFE